MPQSIQTGFGTVASYRWADYVYAQFNRIICRYIGNRLIRNRLLVVSNVVFICRSWVGIPGKAGWIQWLHVSESVVKRWYDKVLLNFDDTWRPDSHVIREPANEVPGFDANVLFSGLGCLMNCPMIFSFFFKYLYLRQRYWCIVFVTPLCIHTLLYVLYILYLNFNWTL